MPFQAKITAKGSKPLLGGNRVHFSEPFIQHGNAAAWLAQCVRTNRELGIECDGEIKIRMVRKTSCADYQRVS